MASPGALTIYLFVGDFESKGDKLSPAAECRIRTLGPWNQISSNLYANWQTDWAMEDQAMKNWTYQPYDQQALSPFDHTADMASPQGRAICMFVGVNFDELATGMWLGRKFR